MRRGLRKEREGRAELKILERIREKTEGELRAVGRDGKVEEQLEGKKRKIKNHEKKLEIAKERGRKGI